MIFCVYNFMHTHFLIPALFSDNNIVDLLPAYYETPRNNELVSGQISSFRSQKPSRDDVWIKAMRVFASLASSCAQMLKQRTCWLRRYVDLIHTNINGT